MRAVRMEVQRRDGTWALLGEAAESERPGSFSSDEPQGRQVYIFGFMHGRPGVWRSEGGVDLEDPATRVVHSLGLEQLSELSAPLELTSQRRSGRLKLRFRVVEDNERSTT